MAGHEFGIRMPNVGASIVFSLFVQLLNGGRAGIETLEGGFVTSAGVP